MRNISSLFRRPAGHANHRVLRLVEAVVRALGGEQLRVRAVLDDLAVIDVEDLVRVLDRRQAVRDDEARAPLEQMLQAGLQHLLKGRTSFIIAHRLSTIENADEIFYIDHGQIVEHGSHAQLLAAKGAYYRLYESQYAMIRVASGAPEE